MQFQIRIKGESSIIHHAGVGIDQETDINREIAKITIKKAAQRSESENVRLRDLETIKSLWLENGQPAVPAAAIRTCIENAARKTKEGPAVREGMMVTSSHFEHKYGTDIEVIAKKTQFTVPVVIKRSRILRTRAKFDLPWAVVFTVDTDPELIDKNKLHGWIELAGRRMGLGDWRPQKSGTFGQFSLESIKRV